MPESTSQPVYESFPTGFQDIGDKSFEWVFVNKKDFVDFTITQMEKPTGLFKQWKNYCMIKNKKHGTPGTDSDPKNE